MPTGHQCLTNDPLLACVRMPCTNASVGGHSYTGYEFVDTSEHERSSLVDIDAGRRASEADIHHAVEKAAAIRAVIEQAKAR